MDRRRFLQLASTWIAASGPIRAMESPARGRSTGPSTDGGASVAPTAIEEAWKRARSRDVPLLVMLARTAPDVERGRWWGRFLDESGDAAHADLALCELVYASAGDARTQFPGAGLAVEEIPLGLVVVPGDAERPFMPLERPHLDARNVHAQDDVTQRHEEHAALAMTIREAVAPTDARFEALAKRVLGVTDGRRRSCESALARRLVERVRDDAPAGARWVTSGGCGEIRAGREVLQSSSGPCGTAMLGPESRRFLWLYTRGGGR